MQVKWEPRLECLPIELLVLIVGHHFQRTSRMMRVCKTLRRKLQKHWDWLRNNLSPTPCERRWRFVELVEKTHRKAQLMQRDIRFAVRTEKIDLGLGMPNSYYIWVREDLPGDSPCSAHLDLNDVEARGPIIVGRTPRELAIRLEAELSKRDAYELDVLETVTILFRRGISMKRAVFITARDLCRKIRPLKVREYLALSRKDAWDKGIEEDSDYAADGLSSYLYAACNMRVNVDWGDEHVYFIVWKCLRRIFTDLATLYIL